MEKSDNISQKLQAYFNKGLYWSTGLRLCMKNYSNHTFIRPRWEDFVSSESHSVKRQITQGKQMISI